MEPCPACHSVKHHTKRAWFENGKIFWMCSDCSQISLSPCYDDVYLGGRGGVQTDPNIVHPKTLKRIPFQTKQEKAVAMRIAGVQQAVSAERVHGYRNESHLHRKKYFEVR